MGKGIFGSNYYHKIELDNAKEQGRKEREKEIFEAMEKWNKEERCYCSIGGGITCECCDEMEELIKQLKEQKKSKEVLD